MTEQPLPAVMTDRLHYTLRFRDYWAFHCLSQFCSPITQLVLVLCGAAFGHWVWTDGYGAAWAMAAGLAAYGAFWLLQCLFNALYLRSRDNRAMLAAHTVVISTAGLRDSTDAYDHLVRWRGVQRVVNYGVVVAVHTSAVDAVVVPRTAFASADACTQWCAQVRGQAIQAAAAV